MRSTHTIHSVRYTIQILGMEHLSEVTQGHVIGRAVNLLREMPAEDVALTADPDLNIDGELHHRRALLIKRMDEALRANYTPRYNDDYGPTFDLSRAEG